MLYIWNRARVLGSITADTYWFWSVTHLHLHLRYGTAQLLQF